MKTDSALDVLEPTWDGPVLRARCSHCGEHPGSEHKDGSGVCRACHGSAWLILATVPKQHNQDPQQGEGK